MMYAKFSGSIKTRFISQILYCIVMTMESLSWGYTPMMSLLEKMIMDPDPLYLVYFLREELEFPPKMVLTMTLVSFLDIFERNL